MVKQDRPQNLISGDWKMAGHLFKRHFICGALLLGMVAEGLSFAALLWLPESNFFAWFARSFHGLTALFANFFPDIVDGYENQDQEFAFMLAVFALGWLQWFVIFFAGLRLYRKYENTAA